MTGYRTPLVVFLLTCGIAQAGEQITTVQTSSGSTGAGELVQVDVEYTTANPENPTLTGIGVRLHWNAELLEYQNILAALPIKLIAQGNPEPDSADFDTDPNTDTFVHLAWADIDSL